jgi:hypothetical protein
MLVLVSPHVFSYHYYNSWFFRLGFLVKSDRRKKNHPINLDKSFVHVQHDWVVKLNLVILTSGVVNKMTNYLIMDNGPFD